MRKLFCLICLFVWLPAAAVGSVETSQQKSADGRWLITASSFAGEMPETPARCLAEQGYEGWHCLAGAMLERGKADDSAAGKRISAMLVLEKNGLRSVVTLAAYASGECRVWDYGTLGLPLDQLRGMRIEGAQEAYSTCFVMETEETTYSFREDGAQDWWLAGWETSDGFRAEWAPRGRIEACGRSFPVWETPWLTHAGSLAALPRDLQELQAFADASIQAWEETGLAMLSHVNLRSRPTAESEWLGSAHAGTLVRVMDTRKGRTDHWYQIQIGDLICWASGPYVCLPEHGRLSHLPLPRAYTLRETVLMDSALQKELLLLPEGTELQILAEMKDNWMIAAAARDGSAGWRMETDSVIGWVHRTDLHVDW